MGRRAEELEAELRDRGLAAAEAAGFTAAWLRAYPMARRMGYVEVARRLQARGLDRPAALETAAMLLALELLSAGQTFPAALGELFELRLELGGARSAAMDAARLRRAMDQASRSRPRRAPWAGSLERLFRG